MINCNCNETFAQFFQDWLSHHGEKQIVRSGAGVSVEGANIRFCASVYGTDGALGRRSAELEFVTTLPDRRQIVDYVAGVGDSDEAATQDALANFALTTFHVLYSAYVNAEDPHLRPQQVKVNGQPRRFYVGDWGIRGNSPDPAVLDDLSRRVIARIVPHVHDDKAHWIKVVYGQIKGETIESETTFDGAATHPIDAEIDAMPWPKSSDFYMLKLFIVVKEANDRP